jgi:hypothetical protein
MHGPLPLPILCHFFNGIYETNMFFDDNRPHVEMFRNTTTVSFLNRFPLKFTTTLTEVTFEGPAIIHFEVFTDLGRVRLLKTLFPAEDFRLYAEDRWVRFPLLLDDIDLFALSFPFDGFLFLALLALCLFALSVPSSFCFACSF